MSNPIPKVKALTFDIFGTVFDWRTTIIQEGAQLSKDKGLSVDWAQFTHAYRDGYEPDPTFDLVATDIIDLARQLGL